jgi:hypothetical protein
MTAADKTPDVNDILLDRGTDAVRHHLDSARRITPTDPARPPDLLNHTGHDKTRSFGSKTKEWEFDSAIMLSKCETDDTAVQLEFTKARLRTPKTFGLFRPQLIRRTENGWTAEVASMGGHSRSAGNQMERWMTNVYFDLSVGVEQTPGHNGQPVRKVGINAIRERMKHLGYFDLEDGKISGPDRTAFSRAKKALIALRKFAGDEGHIWSIE